MLIFTVITQTTEAMKTTTFQVNKFRNKRSKFQTKFVKNSFTGDRLTKYAGLNPIMKYLNKMKLGEQLNNKFPTIIYNSTKFSIVQIMMSIILGSLSGVSRFSKLSNFTADALVMCLLGLKKKINENAFSERLKQLGQAGATLLQEFIFGKVTSWLAQSRLQTITIDADSSVCTVYGNQQGAARGYNPHKKGAKSYHPIIAFASELKIVINSWFRDGSAYTSNGICEFMKQTLAILPQRINKIFFRADSGFFNGELFDLLEGEGHSYLVKVKLKNLKQLLNIQKWQPASRDTAICEFEYQTKNWKKSRKLKAIRKVVKWIEAPILDKIELVPLYEYACYCSNLEQDASSLHEKYKERSTSENWIEQIKNHLLAAKTLTESFHANDIVWQLNVFAYNLSVMLRKKVKKFWSQEHNTFREWFIELPAKIVTSGRQISMKIYQYYYFRDKWKQLAIVIA